MASQDLRKEYAGLQSKIIELASQYKNIVHEAIPSKEYELKRSQLTSNELSGYPETTTMYRSFGKAYLKSEKYDLVQRLKDVEKASEEQLDHLRMKKSIIEKTIGQLDEQQNAIRQAIQDA